MQAQQFIYSANFSVEERRFISRLNQARTLVDQAEFCAKSCLMSSIGVTELRGNAWELKANLQQEEKELFSDKESNCLDNCVYKVFASEKVMKAYLPTRFRELKLNQSELGKRLNNPNQEHGPYFLKKEYEDS